MTFMGPVDTDHVRKALTRADEYGPFWRFLILILCDILDEMRAARAERKQP